MGLFSGGYPTERITDGLSAAVADTAVAVDTESDTTTEIGTSGETNAAHDGQRVLRHIRPFTETDGMDAAISFVQDLYRPGEGATKSMEWWFDQGRLMETACTTDPDRLDAIVGACYPNSTFHTPNGPLPELVNGEYVAGARFILAKDAAYPLRSVNTPHPERLERDPYGALCSALAGTDDERAFVQVVYRSASRSWDRRGWIGADADRLGESLKDGHVKGEFNPRVVKSETDKKAAREIQRQANQAAFEVSIRAFATAPDKRSAQRRIEDVIGAFGMLDNPFTDQRLVAVRLSGGELTAELSRAAAREVTTEGRLKRMLSGPQCVLTAEELAGLVHLPNQEINAPRVDWERMESGRGTPVRGPGFADNSRPASASQHSPSFESDPTPGTQGTIGVEGPTNDAHDARNTQKASQAEAVAPGNGREERRQTDVIDVESQSPPSESQPRSPDSDPENANEDEDDECERTPESWDDPKHSPAREHTSPESEREREGGTGSEGGSS